MKICASIRNLNNFSQKDFSFEGYEIKSLDEDFKPNILTLINLKKVFKGKDLSLHSRLSRIFSCNDKGIPEFSEAELDILKSEIIISKIVGINQVNFHMKETAFTKDEIKKFNEIIEFANKNKIEMVYENHVCSERIIFRILETFPKINFCLDIGHLNIAIHKGIFKMDLDKFAEKIKLRLVNIHAHNNYGKIDEHNSIDKGNFPWKEFLKKLKDSNLKKIIIECHKEEDILKTKKALERLK